MYFCSESFGAYIFPEVQAQIPLSFSIRTNQQSVSCINKQINPCQRLREDLRDIAVKAYSKEFTPPIVMETKAVLFNSHTHEFVLHFYNSFWSDSWINVNVTIQDTKALTGSSLLFNVRDLPDEICLPVENNKLLTLVLDMPKQFPQMLMHQTLGYINATFSKECLKNQHCLSQTSEKRDLCKPPLHSFSLGIMFSHFLYKSVLNVALLSYETAALMFLSPGLEPQTTLKSSNLTISWTYQKTEDTHLFINVFQRHKKLTWQKARSLCKEHNLTLPRLVNWKQAASLLLHLQTEKHQFISLNGHVLATAFFFIGLRVTVE